MYRLNQVKLKLTHTEDDIKKKIINVLKVDFDDIDWATLIILHRSIDARDKKNILYVYNVAFEFVEENLKRKSYLKKVIDKLQKYNQVIFEPIICKGETADNKSPVVVGFGPAGIFAAYIFALNGLKPIIVERGKSIDDRIKDTEKFFETMELDENSNVCFGEGGAGAFSDGKLNTNNKDRDGIYHFVLETFVKFGADEKILYENMPHIGTDKLIQVIKNIKSEIIKLGGKIYYNTKWYYDKKEHKSIFIDVGKMKNESRVDYKDFVNEDMKVSEDSPVVLAIGNSSRDTFRNMIDAGFNLLPKTIAVGYRVAHRQDFINGVQYGDAKNLPSAIYKLTCDVDGKSIYSFCMCPGGYIINSSNCKNKLSINGMSYNDRSGKYANSAIVVTVRPEDILNKEVLLDNENELSNSDIDKDMMIRFQELVEKKAYELEEGYIPYVSNIDIDTKDVFKGQARESKKLKSVYENVGLSFDINEYIEKGLVEFNKQIKNFFGTKFVKYLDKDIDEVDNDVIIAGVETRTSSPVMLERDGKYMCNVENFYPSGEGLGHGGGIMSSAADGVRVAMSIISTTQNVKNVI